jgi:aminopeptidase N
LLPISLSSIRSSPNSCTATSAREPEIIDFLSDNFGPYPFTAAGGIVDSTDAFGFALENQTRPVYAQAFFSTPQAGDAVVVHELAHQWYGDDVTIERWSDICLNECFASYATWLYHEKVGGSNLDNYWKQQVKSQLNRAAFWQSPLVDMGAGNEFSRVYDKGPIALHALRREIGDDAFFRIIKDWPATYGGKNASFDEFEAFVNQETGQDYTAFMDAWFRGTTIPPDQYLYPGDLAN